MLIARCWPVSQCIGMLVLAFCFAIPHSPEVRVFTAAYLSVGILFVAVMLVTTAVVLGHMIGKTQSAIIPCLTSFWYKAYTFILFLVALSVLSISLQETVRFLNGRYKTFPVPRNRSSTGM